nr:aminotransferase class V-fold PLP-dependent enzyme [Austwickia chelonae]
MACLQQEAREGAYETAREHDQGRVYESLARLLGSTPAEIALFDSATRAWDCYVSRLMLPAGSRILITPFEYAGSYLSLRAIADRRDAVIEVIPTTDRGDVDLDWLAARLDDNVAVVSVPRPGAGHGRRPEPRRAWRRCYVARR